MGKRHTLPKNIEVAFPLFILPIAYNTSLFWGILAVITYPIQYECILYYKTIRNENLLKLPKTFMESARYAYGSNLFYVVLIVLIPFAPLYLLIYQAIIGNIFTLISLILQGRNLLK